MVFTDVDQANTTGIDFFDVLDQSLGEFFAPAFQGDQTLSFLGVRFDQGSVVSRARITSGNQILAPGNTTEDLVVMDDFIFGEPVVAQVPEPATLLLLLFGVAATGFSRHSTRGRSSAR